MAKKVIRCKKCGKCAEVISCCGFIRETKYICSRTDEEVSLDDGCTFGVEGKHITGVQPINIDIGGHAAVNGWAKGWPE